GVPQASPALIIAQEYQKRASRIGFEFENIQDMLKKVLEEMKELQEAATPEHQLEEMGDLLFMMAGVARWLHIDAEAALRQANRKFRQRFQEVEAIVRSEGRSFDSYRDDEWTALWERVKEKIDSADAR
nr:MazG nucleotide pyrophosphohydrolase domain-containing protein [Ktedonobacteraceae bacterium]